MKIWYMGALILAILGLLFQLIRIVQDKAPLSRHFISVSICAIFLIDFNLFAIQSEKETWALFFQGCYYASVDFLLISLLAVIKQYLNDKPTKLPILFLLNGVATLDSVSLILNFKFKHAFLAVPTYLSSGEMVYRYDTSLPFYQAHLICCYIIAGHIAIYLIRKMLNVPKYYYRKYTVVLGMFLLVLIMDGVYVFTKSPLNWSLFFYALLSMALYYYTVRFIPKNMLNSMLGVAVSDMQEGILIFDNEDKLTYQNRTLRRMYKDEVPLDIKIKEWRETLNRYRYSREEVTWEEILGSGENIRYYEIKLRSLFDRKNAYIGCYLIIYDRTLARKKYHEQKYKATHDSLTGTLNMDGFEEEVNRILNQYPADDFYLICSNIIDFKVVNNLFGYEKGDEILIKTADLVGEYLHEKNAFGRVKDDRFALLMPKDHFFQEEFEERVDDVMKMLVSSYYALQIRMGIYEIKDRGIPIHTMIDCCNLAISSFEDEVDSCFKFYDESMMQESIREKRILTEFERAVRSDEFVVYLQPQVDAVTGKVAGAEALVRWNHPKQGILPPGAFIDVLESKGALARLDRIIWNKSAKILKSFENTSLEDIYLSVNLSRKDFYYMDVYKEITDLAANYHIPPEKFKLEITETVLMEEPERQLNTVKKLREAGFHVEIDDFGAGFSSLSMLKDFEFDVLKIDMSLVRAIEQDEKSREVLSLIIRLARKLHMEVVAEGVETERQIEYLRKEGCDMFQGYYYSKPVSVEEFRQKYL